ncbi:MAG: purine-nucleoside phosphorylase, partial [Gammaproteobacteria bacterium]|nr:purine-nucleoside phosphorylase [Gammaproteobacteria bacterium]
KRKVDIQVGNIFSADLFYTPDPGMFDIMEKYNILGIEMEAAGLYGLAAEFGAKAATICTVSDHIRTGAALSTEERQSSFDEMIEITLDAAILAGES